ncbi:restriction endonuclease subunit S [Yersinia rohdei]|uniref:restriction endonuclease subunit S n=1 Tax=Yersinia TaxID=629 RepID=UPI0011A7510C|nr:restriction endonuclease subunit S [Yersinia rohdei]EKN6211641.1 restriction endonuclease subunit S [Yersinia enterocolitica]
MSMDSKVPEIRFEGFGGEWAENNLGELIDIRSAARVHKEQWTEAGVPFFRTSDVVSIYKGQENTKAYISHEVYNGLSEKIGKVTKDDLLITGGGSIGIPYLVQNDNPLYFKDADLLWLKNNKKFNGYFLYTFFFSAPFKKHIKSISHTGTIAHYTIEQAKATPINTCYDEEQTQIGNYFQKLDSLINQHQQKHDKLSNIKKAMLEKMFPKQGETIPEIRFKGFSGEWEEKELGSDVADIIGGGTPSTSISEFWDGDIDWYSPTEIGGNVYAEGSQKKITALGLKSSSAKILPAGNTVLFTSRAGIGDMAILAKPGATNQGFQSFIVKEGFSPYFIYSAGKQIKEFALKHASGSTFLEISGKQLRRMKILMPSLEEQTAIGNYFQKLDALINQHQQQITKLNNIKQACLSKMFI